MKQPISNQKLRALLCELLRLFYAKGWVSGTGGGICSVTGREQVLMAPTGVHKERVRPADFFTVHSKNGRTIRSPRDRNLRRSECSPIFCEIIQKRAAGSVMHSHALSAVLAADLAPAGDQVVFHQFEMLKGIQGATNQDKHTVAVVKNTAQEPELLGQIREVLGRRDLDASYCILVRDHGAYIWGADVWEAKRHAEIYHFLFEAALARSRQGLTL